MIRLNKTTKVNNKSVTPFLIQDVNVYCFDNKKKTVILPITAFNVRKKPKRTVVIPTPKNLSVKVPSVIVKKDADEEIIKIKIIAKTSPSVFQVIGSSGYRQISNEVIINKDNKYVSLGSIRTTGAAKARVVNIEIPEPIIVKPTYTPPPVVDNSRYIARPSLDDDYI